MSLPPIKYQRADIMAGQEPSMAELLDGTPDGILTAKDYEASRDKLGIILGQQVDFAGFHKMLCANLVNPRQINAVSSDAGRYREYQAGLALMHKAESVSEYEEKKLLYGQAGQIFLHLGFTNMARQCQLLLVKSASDIGRQDDAAFFHALLAMANGRIDDVVADFRVLPRDYPGRDDLDKFIVQYRQAERLSYTYTAAKALADTMPKDPLVDLVMEKWKGLLASGRYKSSKAIIKKIVKDDPSLKRGLETLIGYEPMWRPPSMLGVPGPYITSRVTLLDLLAQERNPSPKKFKKRLKAVCKFGGEEGQAQVAAVAGIYSGHHLFGEEMKNLIDEEFKKPTLSVYVRNTAQRFLQPDNLAIIMLSYALAGLTTAGLMARLAPSGIEGFSLGARIGVTMAEGTIEAGGFTIYQRLLSELLSRDKVVWNPQKIGREWASLALKLIFVRAVAGPLLCLKAALGKTKRFGVPDRPVPTLNTAGRVVFGSAHNISSTAAFYYGGKMSHAWNIDEMPPHVFDEWLNLILYQTAIMGANLATGGRLNQLVFQVRNRPLMAATQRIAEGMVGAKSSAADQLSQLIFVAHARGDVSGRTLLKVARSFENGTADSVDAVIATNEMFVRAGFQLVYDGRQLYETSPKLRDDYILQLKRQKSAGQDGPVLALAGVSSLGTGGRAEADIGPACFAMDGADGESARMIVDQTSWKPANTPIVRETGYCVDTREVDSMAEQVRAGRSTPAFELACNAVRHGGKNARIELVYKDGHSVLWTGEAFNREGVARVEFVDEGDGLTPGNVVQKRTRGSDEVKKKHHGHGLPITLTYLLREGMRVRIESHYKGQKWVAEAVLKDGEDREGTASWLDGKWLDETSHETRITVENPDALFLQGLENLPTQYLPANPHYRNAGVVPVREDAPQTVTTSVGGGKVTCLLGVVRWDEAADQRKIYVDGWKVDTHNGDNVILPWSLEDFEGGSYPFRIARGEDSKSADGSAGYPIMVAINGLVDPVVWGRLIEKGVEIGGEERGLPIEFEKNYGGYWLPEDVRQLRPEAAGVAKKAWDDYCRGHYPQGARATQSPIPEGGNGADGVKLVRVPKRLYELLCEAGVEVETTTDAEARLETAAERIARELQEIEEERERVHELWRWYDANRREVYGARQKLQELAGREEALAARESALQNARGARNIGSKGGESGRPVVGIKIAGPDGNPRHGFYSEGTNSQMVVDEVTGMARWKGTGGYRPVDVPNGKSQTWTTAVSISFNGERPLPFLSGEEPVGIEAEGGDARVLRNPETGALLISGPANRAVVYFAPTEETHRVQAGREKPASMVRIEGVVKNNDK